MKRSDLITIGVLIAIVGVVGVFAWITTRSHQTDNQLTALSENERTFFATTYESMTGEPVALADYIGDILVVNSWASWCPFCVAELPDLEALAVEYEAQDVTVIAINRAEPPTTVSAYLKSINMSSDDTIKFWLDSSDVFYNGIGGFTMPETVIYQSDGTVFLHKRGFMKLEEMRRHIDEARAANESST